jgi:murein DD-endopeptidase MepM/ murein hydrolase activator NlpD
MNIILLAQRMERPVKIHLSRPGAVAALLAVLVFPLILALAAGYYWGSQYAHDDAAAETEPLAAAPPADPAAKRSMPRDVQETVNALTARLGALQAQVLRLNALGKRLVDMAGLEKGEFNFNAPPPQGGPEPPAAPQDQAVPLPSLVKSVDAFDHQLADRAQQLSVLETLFRNRNLLSEVLPAGRPIDEGWISSYFGYRADPFSGMREFHSGVDLAGKMGEPVVAVAAGVVTYAGKRFGYGNLVEINHGNGFVTRYGHNSEIKVRVGETVSKGQLVALMGSTGRSTGPHVHFEVWRGGRVVDPLKYLNASN